jgi:hypothetical protein
MLAAFKFAKEIADYVNSNYEETTVQVFSEQFGAYGKVHWFSDHENMGAVEQFGTKTMSDEGYLALLAKSVDLFIEGSIRDLVMTSI